jgi:hypothetical protein
MCTCPTTPQSSLNGKQTISTLRLGPKYCFSSSTFESIKHCRHVFFVKERVLRIPLTHPTFRRLGYPPWMIMYMRGVMKIDPADLASEAIRNAFAGKMITARGLTPGDTCSICLDTLRKRDVLKYCKGGCRNLFHAACIRDSIEAALANGEKALCPLCRERWAGKRASLDVKEVFAGVPYLHVAELQGKLPPRRRRASRG